MYVDGFVIAVPKDRIDDYEKVARDAASLWREHGALNVFECVADDVPHGERASFPRGRGHRRRDRLLLVDRLRVARGARRGEREGDGRRAHAGGHADMPFDASRMIFGGFRPLVQL